MNNKVCYIFRSVKHNEFSIEKVFFQIADNFDSFKIFMPFKSNLIGCFLNLLYVIYIKILYRNHNIIFHITGDVYYLMLILPSNKTVITFHDCGILLNNHGLKRIVFYMFWYKLPLIKAKYITTISYLVYRQLCRIHGGARENIKIIFNPLGYV